MNVFVIYDPEEQKILIGDEIPPSKLNFKAIDAASDNFWKLCRSKRTAKETLAGKIEYCEYVLTMDHLTEEDVTRVTEYLKVLKRCLVKEFTLSVCLVENK